MSVTLQEIKPQPQKESLSQKRRKKRKAKRLAKLQGNKIINQFSTSRNHKYHPFMGTEFYQTSEWRKLRWLALAQSSGKCVVCGRNQKNHGVILHVDHVHPRSKYPLLELELSNLQVLCEDCNLGKGSMLQTF
jgi:5-methylcytosine-specific restriction endonuclease McrA